MLTDRKKRSSNTSISYPHNVTFRSPKLTDASRRIVKLFNKPDSTTPYQINSLREILALNDMGRTVVLKKYFSSLCIVLPLHMKSAEIKKASFTFFEPSFKSVHVAQQGSWKNKFLNLNFPTDSSGLLPFSKHVRLCLHILQPIGRRVEKSVTYRLTHR